ncbi:beta-ketoacyl-ACP synthase [Herbaspirillum sp. RTI4]|uniref:beta-ketoacyl-ACP synthase n=1 Tax=Herbaspirillum sp. RTI4 TaxID=3048640 RepID=UPI002AB4C30F|nr:beta-ketoacyl-ACP synthase [Herbaspirillum sp. RTI4]MDY7578923.1 beta-ketoacyl-ACP synthase [Herbaspirillum sp. RTI4]MEA9982012.1 beta-ketoacyl-ACP synthase [Herbaspirillum sp. RTI4]
MMIYLNALGMVCPLGQTHTEIHRRLFAADSGVVATSHYSPGKTLSLGRIAQDDAALPSVAHLPLGQQSRNNRLALAALAQIRHEVDAAIARFGADRIGVIVGTSTSGIAEGEAAFSHHLQQGVFPPEFDYAQQELGSVAQALAQTLGVSGPAYVHSSACASSAKAMASAARLIRMGLCDAVISGGVDSLCRFTVGGFDALQSLSESRCNPLSAHRNGINIGEGAALFLMSSQPATVALRGWGESSDAYHISSPDPEGGGARLAIAQALSRADISAGDIEYINLHGTATPQNDAMESKVIHGLFGEHLPVSSTKPLTGHALGAASAVEAGLCWLTMQDDNAEGRLPPHLWDGVADSALPALQVVAPGFRLGHPPRWVLSNSFAFGGSNAVLIFGRS